MLRAKSQISTDGGAAADGATIVSASVDPEVAGVTELHEVVPAEGAMDDMAEGEMGGEMDHGGMDGEMDHGGMDGEMARWR